MAATAPGRSPAAREPFPWFVLLLVALVAVALVAASAARLLRYDAADQEREQQWRAEHEARMREVSELTRLP